MSSKTRKKSPTRKTARKSIGYKIRRTFKHPLNTAKKKFRRMKTKIKGYPLQRYNSRVAKKILKKTRNARPTVVVDNIHEWYVPKTTPVDFTDDRIRYSSYRDDTLRHFITKHKNKTMSRNNTDSPIRYDDPWGQMISHKIKTLEGVY